MYPGAQQETIPRPHGDDTAQRPQRFYSKETNLPRLTPPSPPQKHAHKTNSEERKIITQKMSKQPPKDTTTKNVLIALEVIPTLVPS